MNAVLSVFRYIIYLIVLAFSMQVVAEPLKQLDDLPSTALVYMDASKQVIITKNPLLPLIPASTVKLLTALMALDTWGLNHRFTTEFYYQKDTEFLWVKGLADPMLVSEEIDLIVQAFSKQGIDHLKGIGIDESYFSEVIVLPGRGESNNPYDAPASALAANFNSMSIIIDEGAVRSQEQQTPLTSLAEQLSQSLPNGKHRINVGLQEYSGRYFAEILRAKLQRADIAVADVLEKGLVPKASELLFIHHNSLALERVLSAMLKYSNNFIASQLYLSLGVEKYGVPASPLKSRRAVDDYVADKFQWIDYQLFDGAGLSRENKLSATQLIDVLNEFKDYIYLLPTQTNNIRAKTGTLNGVSTYAGYIKRNQEWTTFAFMANQYIEYGLREKLADQLSRY